MDVTNSSYCETILQPKDVDGLTLELVHPGWCCHCCCCCCCFSGKFRQLVVGGRTNDAMQFLIRLRPHFPFLSPVPSRSSAELWRDTTTTRRTSRDHGNLSQMLLRVPVMFQKWQKKRRCWKLHWNLWFPDSRTRWPSVASAGDQKSPRKGIKAGKFHATFRWPLPLSLTVAWPEKWMSLSCESVRRKKKRSEKFWRCDDALIANCWADFYPTWEEEKEEVETEDVDWQSDGRADQKCVQEEEKSDTFGWVTRKSPDHETQRHNASCGGGGGGGGGCEIK